MFLNTAFDSAEPGWHLRASGLHCLPLLRGAGRRLPEGGGVEEEERRGWRPGRGRGGTQIGHARRGDEPARCGHARGLGERPLSGDPGPFSPASPARARLRPSASRSLGAVFSPEDSPSGCQDLPLLRPFSQSFCRSHAPLACGLFLPRWASGVLPSPLILFFSFQITSVCRPCRSCARGGKSPLGW